MAPWRTTLEAHPLDAGSRPGAGRGHGARPGPRAAPLGRATRAGARRTAVWPGGRLRDARRDGRVRGRSEPPAQPGGGRPRARDPQRAGRGRLQRRLLPDQAGGLRARQRPRLLRGPEPRWQGDPAPAAVRPKLARAARGGRLRRRLADAAGLHARLAGLAVGRARAARPAAAAGADRARRTAADHRPRARGRSCSTSARRRRRSATAATSPIRPSIPTGPTAGSTSATTGSTPRSSSRASAGASPMRRPWRSRVASSPGASTRSSTRAATRVWPAAPSSRRATSIELLQERQDSRQTRFRGHDARLRSRHLAERPLPAPPALPGLQPGRGGPPRLRRRDRRGGGRGPRLVQPPLRAGLARRLPALEHPLPDRRVPVHRPAASATPRPARRRGCSTARSRAGPRRSSSTSRRRSSTGTAPPR